LNGSFSINKEKLEVLTSVSNSGFSFCYETYLMYISIDDRLRYLLNSYYLINADKGGCNNGKNSVKLH